MIDPRWPDLRVEDDAVKLPLSLWQVDAMIGFGWNPDMPDKGCYTRRHQTRRFADAQYATSWITSLDRLPSHHRLVAVHRTACDWRPVELAELPDPIRYDPSEEDWT